MTERKTKIKPKLEAATTAPLQIQLPLSMDDGRERILGMLFAQAIEGNITAAKLYLEYTADDADHDPSALTADDALKILREQSSAEM